MARTTITMGDLRNSEGISCLNDMLRVVSKTVDELRRLDEENRIRGLEPREAELYNKLLLRRSDSLTHITDELLANDYAPDVWAYVGETLNKLN